MKITTQTSGLMNWQLHCHFLHFLPNFVSYMKGNVLMYIHFSDILRIFINHIIHNYHINHVKLHYRISLILNPYTYSWMAEGSRKAYLQKGTFILWHDWVIAKYKSLTIKFSVLKYIYIYTRLPSRVPL